MIVQAPVVHQIRTLICPHHDQHAIDRHRQTTGDIHSLNLNVILHSNSNSSSMFDMLTQKHISDHLARYYTVPRPTVLTHRSRPEGQHLPQYQRTPRTATATATTTAPTNPTCHRPSSPRRFRRRSFYRNSRRTIGVCWAREWTGTSRARRARPRSATASTGCCTTGRSTRLCARWTGSRSRRTSGRTCAIAGKRCSTPCCTSQSWSTKRTMLPAGRGGREIRLGCRVEDVMRSVLNPPFFGLMMYILNIWYSYRNVVI